MEESVLATGVEGSLGAPGADIPLTETLADKETGAALLRVAKVAAIRARAKERIFPKDCEASGETVGCLGRADNKESMANIN